MSGVRGTRTFFAHHFDRLGLLTESLDRLSCWFMMVSTSPSFSLSGLKSVLLSSCRGCGAVLSDDGERLSFTTVFVMLQRLVKWHKKIVTTRAADGCS